MKVVLIDDEQLAIDVLEFVIEDMDNVEIVGTFTDAKQAYKEIEQLAVDVVFLDMEMGKIHGLQFAEELMTKYPRLEVVFVTAHPQYALEAFEVNAIDYLLKPVKKERLQKTIVKLQEKLALYADNQAVIGDASVQLFAQTMGSFRLVDHQNREVQWRTKKVKELFIYLWRHKEQESHRTRIMEELWSELPDEKAATLMHTTVYQLRKRIKEIGIDNPISLVNERYVLNVDVQSDLRELEGILQSTEMSRSTIEKLIELYQGDFLEDEHYQWAVPIQQKTKQSFLRYLEQYLMQVIDDKKQAYYIEICLEKMIQMEPYNERVVYLLLNHFGKMSKTQKMVALFHDFKAKWIEDLGIDVPQEIVGVYAEHLRK